MGSNAMALFRSVKRLGMTAYRRMFSRRGIVGLTSSEVFSLYMIELMDAPTIKDFAAYIGISQPNATYKINALVEKGYVESIDRYNVKGILATDRREYHIYTTKKCKKLLLDEGSRLEELEAMLQRRFTPQQLEQAWEVFEAILEQLGGEP